MGRISRVDPPARFTHTLRRRHVPSELEASIDEPDRRDDRGAKAIPARVRLRRRPGAERVAGSRRSPRRSRGGNGATAAAGPRPAAGSMPSGPEAIHYLAQDRFLAEGKKLCPEEEAKRQKNPLDMWDELRDRAEKEQFPKGTDVLLTKFHGLFYVAPAQDSYMCRLRLSGRASSAPRSSAASPTPPSSSAAATRHVTTRANLQIREIQAEHSIDLADGAAGPRHRRPGLRRRQHPEHHGQPHGGHRPAGADRHPAARQGAALLHLEPSRDVRPAPQVQHRVRRRRHDRASWRRPTTSASRPSGWARGRRSRRASTSGWRWAGSPGTRTSRATRACCSSPRSACRSRRRSSASSSTTATGPTGRRRG